MRTESAPRLRLYSKSADGFLLLWFTKNNDGGIRAIAQIESSGETLNSNFYTEKSAAIRPLSNRKALKSWKRELLDLVQFLHPGVFLTEDGHEL